MIGAVFDYATPSVFESDRDRALLGIAADTRRPVRFHGRVARDVFLLRLALQSLGKAIWSNDTWRPAGEFLPLLDPVVTVHPDRLMFEAFSQDQSAYVTVTVDPGLFETEGEIVTGTTNVDFTSWLWAALAEMRTSRDTWFRIEPEGFEVRTVRAGGRFERKVDLPLDWVRGFLEVAGGMALPGTRLSVRPVDLLAAIRFLARNKAKVSPRALRYELEPERDARIVLEPWEHVVSLEGAEHGYTELRTVRTWGRRRLRLLEPLLPFADRVDIYLKGRALPSFYAVELGGITFTLGLSGFTGQGWNELSGFSLSSGLELGGPDEQELERAAELLAERRVMSSDDLATALGVDKARANVVLHRLCRRGRAVFDVRARAFRHRELFENGIDEARVFVPDARVAEARLLLAQSKVEVATCVARETSTVRKLTDPATGKRVERELVHRDWHASGSAGGVTPVEIVVDDGGKIIFGRCACEFFAEHLFGRGPCAHMLALFEQSQPERKDLPTSREAPRDGGADGDIEE